MPVLRVPRVSGVWHILARRVLFAYFKLPSEQVERFNASSCSFDSSTTLTCVAIREADLIVVMEKGNIIESGAHEELLAHGDAYASLYNS